jgi:hypothetical protein
MSAKFQSPRYIWSSRTITFQAKKIKSKSGRLFTGVPVSDLPIILEAPTIFVRMYALRGLFNADVFQ